MAAAICHNYTLAMQEYMDLQVERDELCNHLEQIRPALSINTGYGSVSSPSASPTRYSASVSSGWDETTETLDTIPDEETLFEITVEERRLFALNESIKRALTELLNCESVRCDRSMRLWVQSRLMETEKELRSGRRRRSSGTE
ncbi:unnamed protein product [Clonostachys rosea f. rosea IK726]|uniref:Uncharacterized protein n=1 Tax=Clonostachys rosea f. rosea IK726 TaxID=1349383 RepID=A0ACA9U2L2_BIOOC|nr:unnamed protein product [Clonostachys rosea f. rosea IK726]